MSLDLNPGLSRRKKCPQCTHPMMKGPLTLQFAGSDRAAAWWCANCHWPIWAQIMKKPSGSNPASTAQWSPEPK